MATNSILKNIFIKDRHAGRKFATALQVAQNKKPKQVMLKKAAHQLKKTDVKKFFESVEV